VLERLRAESVQAGKGVRFERLLPALQSDALAPSHRTIADDLGMTEGAVRAAAFRIRARYRELLREEVGRTTNEPDAVEEEIRALLVVLAGH
jgi:hypothetical protein